MREEKYMPDFVPVPDIPGFPAVRIDHYGPATVVYASGVQIGTGVKSVEFKREVGEPAKLILECDADTLRFYIPAGKEAASGGATIEKRSFANANESGT